jgi:hypothetical protein
MRQGFEQIWDKIDVWISDFIALIPNIVVSAFAAAFFFLLAWSTSALVR